MRYYIIAGERSGDLHASNLIKALKEKDPEAVLRGFGGEYMESVGVELTVHYNEMAIMGMVEILKNIGKISHYIRKCKEDIRQFKPDVIILVDYGGFNGRIAKFGRIEGFKVFFYIPPKVWAWYQRRALQLKRNVNRIFVILPFEKDFFKKFDMEVDYVGNPVLDAIKAHETNPHFLGKHRLSSSANIVALLPGSRKQELLHIIPIMAEVVKTNPAYQFVVAAIENLPGDLYGPFKNLSNVKLIYEETYDLLSYANAAIVTSGTATLETALFKVPQIVVYKTSAMTYLIVKLLIKVKFISLVNLIAGKEVVKEMIQNNATPRAVSDELKEIFTNLSYNALIRKEYAAINQILDIGSASKNAALLMNTYLTGTNSR